MKKRKVSPTDQAVEDIIAANRRGYVKVRREGSNPYDQAVEDIIAANKAAELMAHFSEELRKQTDELEYRMKRILSLGLKEAEPLSRLFARFEHKRELRNQMELGSFAMECRRVLDLMWKELP